MNKPRSTPVALTVVLALFGGTAGAAADKNERRPAADKPKSLTVALSASISTPRSEVTVRARVEPDDRSRELVIEWTADDLSGGSHTISLEGARAAPSHRFTLKHLSPGEYVVTAILRRNDGSEIRSRSNLQVVGVGEIGGLGGNGPQGSVGGMMRPATQP